MAAVVSHAVFRALPKFNVTGGLAVPPARGTEQGKDSEILHFSATRNSPGSPTMPTGAWKAGACAR